MTLFCSVVPAYFGANGVMRLQQLSLYEWQC